MGIEQRLTELGISLPQPPRPAGAYVSALQTGKLIFVSGQLPLCDGKVQFVGKVGQEVELEQACEAARLCVVNALAALQTELGNLDEIRQVVRLEVSVNSAAGFTDQSQVANGASQLLQEIFGPIGRHTRVAIGAAELPLNAAVELALIAEVK